MRMFASYLGLTKITRSATTALIAPPALAGHHREGGGTLIGTAALDGFLAGVERRAFGYARLALGNDDDALDVVQDAMLRLATHYAARPEAEWPPLFFSILRRRITDLQRRRSVRARWHWGRRSADAGADPVATAPAGPDAEPFAQLAGEDLHGRLEAVLQRLPPRQQQAFLFRILEGMDVAATAAVMGCSAGSIKTHLSRAMQRIRSELQEDL